MKPSDLNYRHLLYFWAVAKDGSITRAAERLGLSVQTISTQLGQLEKQLGQSLLAPQGRSLVLTDAGRTALIYAEQIFHAGNQLKQALVGESQPRLPFTVGITDAVPKLVAFRLLESLCQPPLSVRLKCLEGDFEFLLGELAFNRLDLVIADRSAPQRANVKLRSNQLGQDGCSLYGTAHVLAKYAGLPLQALTGAPFLLPARTDPLRLAIDQWFERCNIVPEIVGEFSDSALLKTFGRAGLGLFPALASLASDLHNQFSVSPLCPLEGVSESWYAIAVPRRIVHPAITHIMNSAEK